MAQAKAICKCHKCGEEFVIYKTCYNRREADNFEEYASKHYTVCKACHKKSEDDKAKEATVNIPLVALTGSDKQIAWANDIRAKAVANILRYNPKDAFFNLINAKTEARWWIDNRYDLSTVTDFAETLKSN
jgi:hypothetical protein